MRFGAGAPLRVRALLTVATTVAALVASVGLAPPAAALCPPRVDGFWIGSWEDLAHPGVAGAIDASLTYTAPAATGTLDFLSGTTVLLGGAPINGTVSCDRVELSAVGGLTLEGVIAREGTRITGTFAYSPSSAYGTFSAGLVTESVTTAGSYVTTDVGGTGATPVDPLQTAVSLPSGAGITIQGAESSGGGGHVGYQGFDRIVRVSAPPAGVAGPIEIDFALDPALTGGAAVADVVVLRNGVPVPDCSGEPGTASPDPCVSHRADVADGDVEITALTSAASTWSFGAPGDAIPGPAVYVGSMSVVEGDAHLRAVQIPVTLSVPSTREVTVDYVVSAVTATHRDDFNRRDGRLRFRRSFGPPITPTTKYVTVVLPPDLVAEPNEMFVVTISSPSAGYVVGDGVGIVTIVDDDSTVSSVAKIDASSAYSYEGDTGSINKVRVLVSLSSPSAATVTVRWDLVGVSAEIGTDLNHASLQNGGTLTFAPGQVRKVVRVRLLPDMVDEDDELAVVTLSAANGGEIRVADASITIADDD